MQELIDAETQQILVARVEVTPAFSVRGIRGLLGRDGIDPETGLLLSDPLGCIHTVGMRFPIDIVFLDQDFRVLSVAACVGPWQLRWYRGSRHQLELAAGGAASRGLVIGRRVQLLPQRRGEGGHIASKSPHSGRRQGEPDHGARKPGCAVATGLPSVPPSGGQSAETTNHRERTSPCARIC